MGRFVRRRFGREAYERIAQPMIGGIYAADPDRLSLRATLPVFREMEEDYGSVLRAIRARKGEGAGSVDLASGPRYNLFVSLIRRHGEPHESPRGTPSGCEASGRLPYPALDLSRRLEDWRQLESAEPLRADALCLAIPAYRAADLVRDLARDSLVLLRAFVGDAFHAHLLELDDRDLGEKISGELNHILGIRERPLFVDVRRHPRSMPQYVVGHLDRVASIRKEADCFRGLTFTGNAFEGIGIPDCIRQSEAAAEKITREIRDAA